jgi:hypothetical protein
LSAYKVARTDREVAWLEALSAMLLEEEAGVTAALEPLVQQTVDDIESLVEALPPTSPSRDLAWQESQAALDKLLSKLNRRFERELGSVLQALQRPLRQHAAELAKGDTSQPYRSAGELLKLIRVADVTLQGWFKEASLSKWAQGISNSIDRQVRKGWARDRAARALAIEVGGAALSAIRNGIENLTSTGVWSMADQVQQEVWTGRWVWRTKRDEDVCATCEPLDSVVVNQRNELPDCPAHVKCRCSCTVLVD